MAVIPLEPVELAGASTTFHLILKRIEDLHNNGAQFEQVEFWIRALESQIRKDGGLSPFEEN